MRSRDLVQYFDDFGFESIGLDALFESWMGWLPAGAVDEVLSTGPVWALSFGKSGEFDVIILGVGGLIFSNEFVFCGDPL